MDRLKLFTLFLPWQTCSFRNHSHLEQGMFDVLQLSPHTDEFSLTSLIKYKQHDFKIINLNRQSISAKIDNLKIVIHNLDNQQVSIDSLNSYKYNAHTNPLFTKMFLLKVGDIHTVQQLNFVYKLTQNNLPAYFNSFIIRRQHNIHERLTRNRHYACYCKSSPQFRRKVHKIFKTVNDTSTQIIDKMHTHSLQGVANYSKDLLIYEYDVRYCTGTLPLY